MLQGEHFAILLTCIKPPFVIRIFVLSIFEWPFYTSFTVIYFIIFSDKQTILSPVVLCGPTDLILQKPVVLSIQHCASMRQGGWKLSVCSSRTPLEEPPQWQVGYCLKTFITRNIKIIQEWELL